MRLKSTLTSVTLQEVSIMDLGSPQRVSTMGLGSPQKVSRLESLQEVSTTGLGSPQVVACLIVHKYLKPKMFKTPNLKTSKLTL